MMLAQPAPLPSTIDPPFLAPIETTLDLPIPPSVNRTRKKHGPGTRLRKAWQEQADMYILATGGLRRHAKMLGKFEVTLILDEKLCNLDLDNPVKAAIDYAKRLNLIVDDNKRYMRAVHILWGTAPEGCRLILRSVAP